jgi:hypothetical protein
VLGESAKGTVAGECDKCGTKNGHQLTLPSDRPGDKAFARDSSVSHSEVGERRRASE